MKTMDQLEQYIRRHEEELDRVEPVDAEALWQRIRKAQAGASDPRPAPASGWQLQIGRNWRWAAAATVAMAVGMGLWWFRAPADLPARTPASVAVVDYYPDIADEERAFRQNIARREAELGLPQLDRRQYIDIFQELDELEQIHRRQIQDLPQVFDSEAWVATLMRYYEQKLRILEHLAREIDKQRQREERSRARSS